MRGISVGTNTFRLAVYNDIFTQSTYNVTVDSNDDNDGNAITTLSTTGSNTDL